MRDGKLKGDEDIDGIKRNEIEKLHLQRFLGRTDFMSFIEIKSIVERLFNKGDWEKVKTEESYKVLFSEEGSGSEEYENLEFKDVHEKLVGKSDNPAELDKYVHLPMEAEISKDAYIQKVKKSIFGER